MEYEHLDPPEGIAGASGVVRSGDELLTVSDDIPGCYFRVAIKDDGPLIKIPADAAKRCDLSAKVPEAARLALDVESVGVLVDGRLVVLSERLRCLIDDQGVVAQYDDPFGELFLRVVALRAENDGRASVARLVSAGDVQVRPFVVASPLPSAAPPMETAKIGSVPTGRIPRRRGSASAAAWR